MKYNLFTIMKVNQQDKLIKNDNQRIQHRHMCSQFSWNGRCKCCIARLLLICFLQYIIMFWWKNWYHAREQPSKDNVKRWIQKKNNLLMNLKFNVTVTFYIHFKYAGESSFAANTSQLLMYMELFKIFNDMYRLWRIFHCYLWFYPSLSRKWHLAWNYFSW